MHQNMHQVMPQRYRASSGCGRADSLAFPAPDARIPSCRESVHQPTPSCVSMRAFALSFVVASAALGAQTVTPPDSTRLPTVSGLKLRSIGPALTSGRVADIAVDPTNKKVWYIGAAAGGARKTVNGGTSFTPICDNQGSVSIGPVTIDPKNPNIIWVGTGEDNTQPVVAHGDGVYRSQDGGRSWSNMGLKESEHIGRIVIDPRNSDVVYVAAQGPLWRKGG